ncbi:Disease resistance protein [Artemisia annua]|uniref:Disease resistance protein n=1 Tax=Artemisia annua TaxID=35608 RepID=A0A2U1PMP7_ARTAN|nr:Disease resistance protein [Artemisia annua]
MAEIVITAAVTVLFEKLASVDFMNMARSEGISNQLTKWKKHLILIQAVLDDAAQQQITRKPVELWLHQLHDLAYDIEDVLDDMATEVMTRKLNHQETHANTSTSQVFKIIPACCTNFTPRKIKYGRKISSKLDEITTRLHDLVEQKDNLGLRINGNVETQNRSSRLEQTSLLDDACSIVGREVDKKELLEFLLGDEPRNAGVFSIIKMFIKA